ncbi:MAG: hypothetical protein WC670_09395 [Pseudolabrys sp.]
MTADRDAVGKKVPAAARHPRGVFYSLAYVATGLFIQDRSVYYRIAPRGDFFK